MYPPPEEHERGDLERIWDAIVVLGLIYFILCIPLKGYL